MVIKTIKVEICYVTADHQEILAINLPRSTTVIRAIMQSGILDKFPDLQLENNVGIFSRRVSLNDVIVDGDRIEIYRPLILSPNELRQRRRQLKNN
jgi:uncharacterized protein